MKKHQKPPRYNVISLRVSDMEYKMLQEMASQHALSISDMIRRALEISPATNPDAQQ